MNSVVEKYLNEIKKEENISKRIELFRICKNKIYNTKEMSYKEKVYYLHQLEILAISMHLPT